MKKSICLIIILFLAAGCSSFVEKKIEPVNLTKETSGENQYTTLPNKPEIETITVEKEDTRIIKGDIKVYEDFLTAADIEEDIDGDALKERIILNISPSPVPHHENEGQYLWDSSHVWQLIVEDEENNYTLFDDQVQGLAEFYVVNEKENQNAIVFLQKGTNISLAIFRYKDDYFEKEVVYNSEMLLHRSTIQ